MTADIIHTTDRPMLESAMRWQRGRQFRWVGLSLGLGVILLGTGCGTQRPGATDASPATTVETSAASGPQEETIAGFKATVIDPPRMTTLATQTPGAQINLRSQPTTLSPILGNGQTGDEIRLLRLAEGEAGYSWYYVQFTQSDTEGWVRGDFVDAANATATVAPAEATTAPVTSPAQAVVATTANPCGGDRQEAHFETQSYAIYLCNTAQGLRYISTNKATKEALVTDDVAINQNIYIAIDGNQQYHISDTRLAIYEVNQGSYTPLTGEPVLRFERFIY